MKPNKPASAATLGSGPYKVALYVDPLMAHSIFHRPLDVDMLSIGPGPEADCFTVTATASATQLLKLALWAADNEPNVTVRSPLVLHELVELMLSAQSGSSITLAA